VLGVWAGARAGMDFIPAAYWKKVYEFWSGRHNEDGGWDYGRAGVTEGRLTSYPAMTAGRAGGIVMMLMAVAGYSTILAWEKCPHCKQKIKAKSLKCPHCGTELRKWYGT